MIRNDGLGTRFTNNNRILAVVFSLAIVLSTMSIGTAGMVDEVYEEMGPIQPDSPIPTLNLLTPSREIWKGGDVLDIEWTIDNNGLELSTDPVNVYYSINGGAAWTMMAEKRADDGSFSWKLPYVTSESCFIRIRAQDSEGNVWNKVSDSAFVIDSTKPSVKVHSPNGNEVWAGGSTQTIRWSVTDNYQTPTEGIDIFYSINGGLHWTLIAANEQNDGSYEWTVPEEISETCQIKIDAVDAAGNMNNDRSDRYFTISYETPTPLNPGPSDEINYVPHAPIRINGDADFPAIATAGDGNPGTPWVIENWDINGNAVGYCIYIGNTTEHFVVRNCSVHNASGIYSPPYFYKSGLVTYNCTNGIIENVTAHNNTEQIGHSDGFNIVNSQNMILMNNLFINNFALGVMISGNSDSIMLVNNVFINNSWGIETSDSDYLTIINNTFTNNRWAGLYLYGSEFSNVYNNSFTNDGIYLQGTELDEFITHDIPENNSLNGKPITYLVDQIGGVVNPNAGQIILANCQNLTIGNFDFSDCYSPIQLGFSSNITIHNNNVNNCHNGVIFQWSDNNTVEDCVITNGLRGLFVYYRSNDNIIRDCYLSSHERGIVIWLDSNSNFVINNTIEHNTYYGIYVYLSTNNQLYHNKIVNNTNQAFDNTGLNQWDNGYPSGGNYWSDYSGVDYNSTPSQDIPPSDGIGDTPYTNIDGGAGAQDNYPLYYGPDNPGPVDYIIITPDPATVTVGTQQQFNATAYDEYGNVIQEATFFWSTDVGVIDFTGLLSSQTFPGTGFVSATYESVTGTAVVNIVEDEINYIVVTPSSAEVEVGGSEVFTAAAFDVYNNPLSGVVFDWDTDVGSVAGGFFTAQTIPGVGVVTATNGMVTGVADVIVYVGDIDQILVTPDPITVVVGDEQQFTAIAYDQYMNAIPGVTFDWSTTIGTVDATGLFTAQTTPTLGLVSATNGSDTGSAFVFVEAGPVDRIDVTPNPENVVVGESQSFLAIAYDEYNNVLSGITYSWSTDVGSVDGTGLFTAQTTPGVGVVQAMNSSITGTAVVTVEIGALDHITVTPDPATVQVGEQLQFTATAYDNYSNIIPGVVFDWSTDIGTIDADGLFTAPITPTTGWVQAVNDSFNDTAIVSVIEGEVHHIVLIPDTLIIKVGETQQFNATAYDQYNNVIIDALMFWTSTPGAGVVNSDGFFTAQTIPGSGFVNVTSGSVTASANITVLIGDLHHIVVTPSSANIIVGTSQAFTADAYDAYDNLITGVNFTWGTDVGTIDSAGFFTAQTTTGSGMVWATNESVTGFSFVNIVPGIVDSIVVTPDPVNVTVGENQLFSAIAYDNYSNEIPGVLFSWSTNVGSVDGTGLFTAQTTLAVGFVSASNNSHTGFAVVNVVAGPLDHIIVTPDPAIVIVGDQEQFTATGYDVYDNVISGMTFTWNTNVGAVDAVGLFTAQTIPATGFVRAKNGNVNYSAVVNVVKGPVYHIVVTPDPASVMVGETQQFTATGYDLHDNVITGLTFTWSTDLGIVNSTGFFTAFTTAQSGFVNATSGAVTGSANVTVTPGLAHRIEVAPTPVDVVVGTTQPFTASAYDVYDNPIPSATFLWSSNIGVVNFEGLFTAQSSIATGFVNATINGVTGSAIVTLIPGPLHHIIVTPNPVIMTADSEKQFAALGYDVYNNPLSISPTWEVDGGGTVDATGYFIADIVGNWIIYANDSGISGSALITILHGVPVSLVVTPATATITSDDILLYTATASDADGNSWDATPGTVFSEDDPKGAMVLNAYYAGQVGTWTVTGIYGGLNDTATVNVLCGAAAFIVLDSPSSVTAGDVFSVTVTVYDADSNVKTDYDGTIWLNCTDPYPAVLPPNHTYTGLDAGTYTFTGLVLYTRPSQTITATDTGNATLTDSDVIDVLSPFIQPEKSAPANAEPGEIITYKIYYNNTGDTVAASVWLNDTLPTGVNFINASDGGIESGGVVSWVFTNLLPGIWFVTINVSLDAGLTNGTILANWVFCNFTAANGIQFTQTSAFTETRVFFLPVMSVAKTVELVLKDIIVEPDQWGTASVGSTMSYMVNVTNLQQVNDTIDLDYMTLLGWNVTFFLDDGVTPLPDTNNNSLPDTDMLVANGGNISIYVDIGIPGNATVGEEEITYIFGTSFADPNVIDVARLNTTVIPPAGGALLALVIDNSNSMGRDVNGTTPIDEAKKSAKLLVNNITDESLVSIWTFSGTNPTQVLPLTLLAGGGRDTVNASIDGLPGGGMTPIWDTMGAAYEDIKSNMPVYPEHIPAIIALSDGADYQSNDDSAIKIQMLERGSDNWAPWHEMYIGNDSANGYRIVDYAAHYGKYSIPWDTIPGYWYSTGTYGGALDPRIGLLNSDMLMFTIGLALEGHDPVDQPQKDNWTEAITDDVAYYTNGTESGTVEYNLWRIANTSGADYFYAPSSSELQIIYSQIAGIISALIGSSATGSKESISAGDSLMYKIYYNNTGMGNAAHVWINDTLPECLILVGTNASVPWTYANGQYSWHFTNVTPGSHWFWIEVEIDNTVVDNQSIVNQVFLDYTDSEGDPLPGSNDTATVTVSEPLLTIEKVVSPTSAEPGDYLNYTIYYNNTGTAMALFVWINDTFDPYVTYISDTAPVVPEVNGQNYSWMIPGIMPGNYSFNITVRVNDNTPGGTVIGNTVTAEFTNEDNVLHNESSTSNEVNTSVSNTVISVEKLVNSGITDPGKQLVYTIYFNNTGSDNANFVWINDTLPDEVSYVGNTAATSPTSAPYYTGSSVVGQVYGFSFADVTPGDHMFTITVQVNAGLPDGTQIVNGVELDYTDDLGFTLPGSIDTALSVSGAINITKNGDRSVIPVNGTFDVMLTITITNCHPTITLNNLLVADTLPPGITWAGRVTASKGSWVWDGNVLNWTMVDLLPLETATLSYDVSVSPSGEGTYWLNNGASATGSTATGYVENATSNAVSVIAQDTPVLDFTMIPVSTISTAVDTYYLSVTNIGTDGIFYDAANDIIEMVIPATWGDPTSVAHPLNWDYQWNISTRTLSFYHSGGNYPWASGASLMFNFDLQAPATQGTFGFDTTGSIHDAGATQYYLNRTLYVDVSLGLLDHILVTPSPVTMPVGGIQAFTAVAYDIYNNVIPGVGFDWSTDVGSVDSGGLFTAQTTPASGVVTASNSSVNGSAIITLIGGGFDHITVAPDPAFVSVGGTQLFTAIAWDVYGNPLSGIGFDWTTNVGSIDQTGLFAAPVTPTVGIVTATNGTISYSATVNVIPGNVHHIIVEPNPVTVTVGLTEPFTATAYDVYNNEISTAVFVWSSTVGSVNALGLLTAQTTPGLGLVTATSGNVSGSAVVTIIIGPLDHITVSPDLVNVTVGQVWIFTATGYDVYDNPVAGVVFAWNTDVGSVDSSGLFIAQITPGVGVVNATNGSVVGTAVVNVISGDIDHIVVTPNSATVVVGTTQLFVAIAYDVFNNEIPGVDFIWTTDVGTIDMNGLLTAQTFVGSGQVTATNETISGLASVDVIAGLLDHITVTPGSATVKVGDTEQFTATAYDVHNNVLPGVVFNWTTDVGSVDATGFFTAQITPGIGVVTATNDTFSDSANVNVVAEAVDSIIVTPDPAIVIVGQTQQFTAEAFDIFNNPILGASFIWSTDVGIVNSTGYFTAETTPQAGVVSARIMNITGNASVTVVLGAVHHIIVSPDPVNITVGGSQAFSAEAFDEYNNLIPGVGFTWSTDVGSVDGTGQFTAQTIPGTGVVSATNDSVTGNANVEVVVGAINYIILIPDPVDVIVGQERQFTATAFDVFDNIIPGVEFEWTTNVGSVDSSGLFTAQTVPGSGTVTATNDTVSDSANVTVIVGPVDHILVVPDPVSLMVGENQTFSATAYDEFNNVIIGATFTWTTNVGSVTVSGFFTAQTFPGSGVVSATNDTVTGSASVTVLIGDLDHITVDPTPVVVTVGGMQAFTATAFDIYNNTISGIDFNWTTDVGSIDASGQFTAQTIPGVGTVTATNGAISGYADVVVVAGSTIYYIIVTPDPVAINVGDTLTFTATAYDEFDNVISGVDFVWTTDVGSVDATGFFTAQTTPGSGTVTAANGTVNYSANVTVNIGPIHHIIIVPDPTSVIVGQNKSFTATAFDIYNNVILGAVFDWTTDVGSIDASGLFTAQTMVGTGYVNAMNYSVSSSAIVFIIAGALDHIIVTPDPATVMVDGSQQFTAVAYDIYNNTIPGVEFTWDTNVGSVDATGLFVAQSTPGNGTVNATNETITGSAFVEVVNVPIDHIVVIPDPVTIIVGETETFIAIAFDEYNNVIFGVDFVWTTNVGTIDDNGFFTAQTIPGTGVVTATNDTISYSATVNVIPGPIHHIILTPSNINVTVGDTEQFDAIAYDVYDNTLPGVEFTWMTNVGSVDATGFFTAQTTPGTGIVMVSNGTHSDTAQVEVVIGDLHHIGVTPDPVTLIVGSTQAFTAVAYDVYNNIISGIGFNWTTDVGSVDSFGFFTAQTTPGIGQVMATNSSVNGTASVVVEAGPLDHIVVTPDQITIMIDGDQQFIAVAYDSYNNILAGVEFNWTTDVGSVDATGLFTAQSVPGIGYVNATNGTFSGVANVEVVDVNIDHIIVLPNPVSVVVLETQTFTAKAYDILNNEIAGVVFIWDTNVGSVDSNGFFTAQNTPGTGEVTATNDTVSGSATVNVVSGNIDYIIVTPDPATVVVGMTQAFTATAYDVFDNVILGVEFNWTTDVGSVDATGLFTAQTTTGLGIVIATNDTYSYSATVIIIAGAVDSILVLPDPAFVTVGDVQQFNAFAFDQYGNAITGMTFNWTTDVGSIDNTGLFTAQTASGVGIVTATNDTVSGFAVVNVLPGPLDHIIVTPNPANVTVGTTQMFTAVAYDEFNNIIPGVVFIWTTDVGSIDLNGTLTAQTIPGSGSVTATSGTISGSAVVNIVVGSVHYIIVLPDPVTVEVGGTQAFTATAYDEYNNIIPSVDFVWTTDVGSVDAVGSFTAQTTPGAGVVTATNLTISGDASVTVIAGPLDHIIVIPDPVSVTVGGNQAFTATAYDSYNNVLTGIGFNWTTDVGAVDTTGFFTAQTVPGSGTVTATNGLISGSANVTVVVGPLNYIIVIPDSVNVTVGDTQPFTATGYDVFNNVIPGMGFNWTTDVGSIDPTGSLTAQTVPGIGTVTATNETISGFAVVTIIPGPLDHIIVTPDPISIIVDGVQQFVATAYDSFNNVLTGVTFTWATDVGSVDATGLFIAQSTPGIGFVNATSGTVTGWASVTVVDVAIDHIVVTPDPATVTVGTAQLFIATAYDNLNNAIAGVVFEWSTDVGTIDSSGLFTAQTLIGVGIVTATNVSVNGSATVILIPGPIYSIIVIPDPAIVAVGGTQLFIAIAYDNYSNVISGVDYNWSTDVGVIDDTGFFTAQTVSGTGIVTATYSTVSDSATVIVEPGDLHHIIVNPDPVIILVNGVQQFTATAYDQFNNVIPGVGFEWSTDVGSVDATGLFTAQATPAIGVVTATNDTISGSAAVTVILGLIDYIIVTPDPATVVVAGNQQFIATAYDSSDNVIPGVIFVWTTDVGTINSTGYFTARTMKGVGIVTASNGGINYSATVILIPESLDHIIVIPDPAYVVAGGSLAFTGIAYDVYDNVILGVGFNWSTDVGSIDASGFFTAQTTTGNGTVTASNVSINGSATVYIEPGLIDHIIVTPGFANLTVGSTQAFTAVAYDVFNNIIPGVEFNWSTDVGSVDAFGFFTAQTVPGSGTVIANNGSINGTAFVTVLVGPIDHIIVLPDPVNMTVGGTMQFNATAYDSFNNVIPGVVFNWTTDVGIVDSSGFFTAQTTPGVGLVTAENYSVNGSATVVIEAGPLDHIIVTPVLVNLYVGDTQAFNATAYDSFNNVLVGIGFNWSTDVGSVDATGFFTAQTFPGSGTVVASNGSINGSAIVNVMIGLVHHIIVLPDPVSVGVGGTQQFNATAYDFYDNIIPTAVFNWSTDVGSVDALGFFIAQFTTGTGVVTATSGAVSGSANVTILPGPLHHIIVTPNPINILINGSQQFTAVAYDEYNNVIPGAVFNWSTNVGVVDANGLFTAQATPGTGYVNATIGLISDSASVTVVDVPIVYIIVTPNPATVTVGGTQAFIATAYDQFNNPIMGVDFNWITTVGVIDASGVLTAQTTPGSGNVTATNGTLSDSANVTVVVGPVDHIIVTPDPATVTVGDSMAFTTIAYDSFNNIIIGVSFNWTTTVGVIDASGILTAQTVPGSGTVTANNGSVYGSANVTVVVGELNYIIVNPDPVNVTVGETQLFTAIGYDVFGNVIPGVVFNWSTDVGSIDQTGLLTAQTVPGSGTVTASNNSINGSANVTIIPGPVDHIIVTPNPVNIMVNGVRGFAAAAYDIYNNFVPGVTFNWTTDVGTVDATGLFTAQSTPGVGTVNATVGSVTGYANVTVVDVPIDHIVVTPNPANVTVGTTQLFTATAYDQFNNEIMGVAFEWVTNVGTIDATGLFTAQTLIGVGIVTATNGSVNGSASVTIIPGPIDNIIVTPDPVTVTVGGTQAFNATAYDQFNNPILGVVFNWTTTVGVIDASGVLTAQTTPGFGNVTATNLTISGLANVTVEVGPVDHIVVNPDPATVTVGGTQAFTAVAYDVYNNTITGAVFNWATDVGIVFANGLFLAQTFPGSGLVTATIGSVNGSANVTVVAGPLHHIIVLPDPITLTVGGSQAFTATAYDFYNNVLAGVGFNWTTNVGSVDSSGFFTAMTIPGFGTVTASNGTVSGSASVTVLVGPIDHIIVTPNPINVTVDGNQTFTAIAYDSFNNVLVGVEFNWTTDVGSVDATGFFTAHTITGTGVVTASNGTVNGSANVTILPGPLHHIIVTPDPVFVFINGDQQFTATGYDIYNNIIPGVVFSWITDVGVVNSTGLFTAQSTPNTGIVGVINGSVVGSAIVNVVNVLIDYIIVTPDPANVMVGETEMFTATAYDQFDNPIMGIVFNWTTNVGSIDATGLFTAQTTPGNGNVTATNGSVSGNATVNVLIGALDHIIVIPDPVTVVVGETQQFLAFAYDFFNNLIPGVGFLWTTDVGSVNATGFFTADIIPGIGTVTATNDTISGSASVTVVANGTIAYIIVTPDPVIIIMDGVLQFTATAYDIFNNVIPGVDFNWFTDVGSINSTGFFTAQAVPGIGTVEATNGTVTGVANVEVVDSPPIANAGPDQLVPQHTLVTFNGNLSTDDVGIDFYWWNFTDGGPQSLMGVAPSYTFDNEGVYTVTLTVMDTVGQTDSDVMLVNVTDGDPPVAEAGPDQQVIPGGIVTFDGTASYDPGHLGEPIINGIVNWTWTFDDGTGPQTLWDPNPTHQFNKPGVYLITLTVTDNAPVVNGGPFEDTDTMTVTVLQKFDIDITPAAGSDNWILVSFPNQVSGDPLVIVQDAIDEGAGLVTWDIIQTYDSTTGEWLTTATFKPPPLNTFNYVDNFMGFWIHITNYGDGNLTIIGALATSGEQAVIPLKAGWNLIGYPFPNAQEMFNTFGTLASLDRDIEVYDPTDPYRLRVADVWTEWHDPGGGYWVHVAFDEDLWIWNP